MAFEFQTNVTLHSRYIQEQFTKFLPNFIQPDIGSFWGLDSSQNMVKSNADLPLGLEEIKAFSKDYIGEVAEFNGNATDIPTVDVILGELKGVETAIHINAANWTKFELYKQQLAQKNRTYMPTLDIVGEKMLAMGEFHDRNEHDRVLFGLPNKENFKGLYNQSDVRTLDVTDDVYALTPSQLYDLFIDWVYEFKTDNQDFTNLSRIEMNIPTPLMKRLSRPYNDNYDSTSVFSRLTDSRQGYYVGAINDHFENEGAYLNTKINKGVTAYPTNRDRIIIKLRGNQNPKTNSILGNNNLRTETLERHYFPRLVETPFTPDGGLTWKVFSFGASTGVYTYRPQRIMYVDINNASK